MERRPHRPAGPDAGPLDPAIDPEEPQVEPSGALPRPLHPGAQLIQQRRVAARQVFRRRDRLGEGGAGDMGRDGTARRDRLRRDRPSARSSRRVTTTPNCAVIPARGIAWRSAIRRIPTRRNPAAFRPAAATPRPAIPPRPDGPAPAARWRSAPRRGGPSPRRRRGIGYRGAGAIAEAFQPGRASSSNAASPPNRWPQPVCRGKCRPERPGRPRRIAPAPVGQAVQRPRVGREVGIDRPDRGLKRAGSASVMPARMPADSAGALVAATIIRPRSPATVTSGNSSKAGSRRARRSVASLGSHKERTRRAIDTSPPLSPCAAPVLAHRQGHDHVRNKTRTHYA